MSQLRIALRNYADFENALGEEAGLFEALRPGTKVELHSVGIHELYNSAITDGGLHDGRFDLALLVTDWLAEAHAAEALDDLNLWQKATPIRGWPQEWPCSLVKPLILEDCLTSLPWHDGPECLVYRSDLFSDSKHQSAFRAKFSRELAPPATWEEFEETARYFTDPSSGRYGTVFAAFPDGHNTLYDFALQVWSRGGELTDVAGRPNLIAPHALDALEFYRRVVRDPAICHPKSPQLDSTQSGDLFLAGEVAMMANWFGFAARSGREGSPLAGKVAIAPIPAANGTSPVSLSVFWALAMGKGSRQKELAWEFLRFVASPERDLGITRHGAVGVRLSTWRNPELQARNPVYSEVESISLGARQLPTGPGMAAFAAIIDDVISRSLTTDEPSAAILESAQREIDSKGIRFQ
ncbi:extracellular solute-binding protein [Telmatobacter sp. DSM 110680]|uniref:Extracellular solute-binding protein n=1 Tax=Telmatobacter sp. DSM 110680 TaxID=3036704 RepID=A0AAU7DGR1_9BACT